MRLAATGRVSTCRKAASASVVTSLMLGSSSAAPTMTRMSPGADAFVSACMRSKTSPKRSTPIPANSVSTHPIRITVSPITNRAPR